MIDIAACHCNQRDSNLWSVERKRKLWMKGRW